MELHVSIQGVFHNSLCACSCAAARDYLSNTLHGEQHDSHALTGSKKEDRGWSKRLKPREKNTQVVPFTLSPDRIRYGTEKRLK